MATIKLDTRRCAGHAMCNAKAAEVFDLDDDGYCVLLAEEVAGDERLAAIDGAQACPEQALEVID